MNFFFQKIILSFVGPKNDRIYLIFYVILNSDGSYDSLVNFIFDILSMTYCNQRGFVNLSFRKKGDDFQYFLGHEKNLTQKERNLVF